jgi:hypothetical protein
LRSGGDVVAAEERYKGSSRFPEGLTERKARAKAEVRAGSGVGWRVVAGWRQTFD